MSSSQGIVHVLYMRWSSSLSLITTATLLSSKDGLVKVWDLDTRHCFQTIPMHRAEVWCLEVCRETLIIGSNRLSKFKLQPPSQEDKVSISKSVVQLVIYHYDFTHSLQVPLIISEDGQVTSSGQDRALKVKADREGRHFVSLVRIVSTSG